MKVTDFKPGAVVEYEIPLTPPLSVRGSVISVDVDGVNILGNLGDSLTIGEKNFDVIIQRFKVQIIPNEYDEDAVQMGKLISMFGKDDFDISKFLG
jgi:hypothetical protein